MYLAALELERQTGELNRLSGLATEFLWLSLEAARTTSTPLVTTGINMLTGQDHWRSITAARMSAGLGTIVIPAFKPGDYAPVAQAPTPLEAVHAQAQSLAWEDSVFQVPASVAFRTKLHAAKWSVLDGVGALLLSYRPTNACGCVVFCGGSIASRRAGADPADQARLLQTLLSLAAPVRPEKNEVPNAVPAAAGAPAKMNAAEFLAAFPDFGPQVLLLRLAGWDPRRPEHLSQLCHSLLGCEPDDRFQSASCLQADQAQIESALRQAGWATFVRKVHERLSESTEEAHA